MEHESEFWVPKLNVIETYRLVTVTDERRYDQKRKYRGEDDWYIKFGTGSINATNAIKKEDIRAVVHPGTSVSNKLIEKSKVEIDPDYSNLKYIIHIDDSYLFIFSK
jgi:hypothetical protein